MELRIVQYIITFMCEEETVKDLIKIEVVDKCLMNNSVLSIFKPLSFIRTRWMA